MLSDDLLELTSVSSLSVCFKDVNKSSFCFFRRSSILLLKLMLSCMAPNNSSCAFSTYISTKYDVRINNETYIIKYPSLAYLFSKSPILILEHFLVLGKVLEVLLLLDSEPGCALPIL